MSEDESGARPLRIAHFTDNYGPGRSGILFAVQQLEGTLLAQGHDVVVVAPASKGPNPYRGHPHRTELRMPSVRMVGVPARVATGRKANKTLATVEAWKPDVIHVHGLGLCGLLGVALARRTDTPLLVTWHTDWEAYAAHYGALTPLLDGFYRFYRYRAGEGAINTELAREAALRNRSKGRATANLLGACAAMLAEADLVTSPSPKTVQRVLRLAPSAAVRCVPNGVDPLPEGAPPVKRSTAVRLLYVGRISPEKGIGTLLDAFSIVHDNNRDTELMLVGDWKRTPRLRARFTALKRTMPSLKLVGEVDRGVLRPYYEAADVFVFPSQTDTQALVLHEAAYAGLPIVSCDPELTLVVDPQANGEFAPGSADALAGAMLRMVDRVRDENYRQRAAAAGRLAAARYTIDGQNAAMLAIYAELASKSARLGA